MVSIERARIEQVAEIRRVLSETWLDTYASFLSKETIARVTETWHDPKRLMEQISNRDIFFAVAKDEQGAIVGLITARLLQDNGLFIGRLYVLPAQQRKRIGRRLLDASISAYPQANRMRLEVEEKNHNGLAFYRWQGFKQTGRKQAKVGEELLENIEMEKTLP